MTTSSETPRPDPNAVAAHEFLSELRTRITTQRLPYLYGTESAALSSLWGVFEQAREAMKRNPGCQRFAAAVTDVLNMELRPVTAKWHRAYAAGRLASRDGADEFRADLAVVRDKLQAFSLVLQEMAYGEAFPDQQTPEPMTEADLEALCSDVRFGIDATPAVPQNIVAEINRQETDEVAAHRAAHRVTARAGHNAVGLGLSGGGIRSATFCLGVIQVLADRDLLKHVDFLSTVSGGGYTGSFLTARLGDGAADPDIGGAHGPDPEPIRFLRHHAKYLAAANLKQSWLMVTASLAGMLLNWSAPILLVLLAAVGARRLAALVPNQSTWFAVLGGSLALCALSLVLYGALMRGRQKVAQFGGTLLGIVMGVTVVVALGCAVRGIYTAWSLPSVPIGWRLPALLAALVTAGPTLMRFLPILEKPAVRRIVLKVLLLVAGVIVPLGGLLLFYAAFYAGGLSFDPALPAWNPLHYGDGVEVLTYAALALAVISVFILNINLTGPHRLYRDMLAAAFVKKADTDSGVVEMSAINSTHRAPYHLVNTTVNLPTSANSALRDRRADFFIISKLWCGSPVVGYRPTPEWRMNTAAPDLATAMAISGAAASSHMGLGSMPTLVALLTFLNVRLGFWIRRPGSTFFPRVPGFMCLIREMTGIGMSEKRAWLNLSDGGHIENMATYELLRRRCKYVICVDGEADPAFTFLGLMTLVRHAQLDFGIRIEPSLDSIRPNPDLRSEAHAILCRIHYPAANDGRPPETGLLLYLKLSVTGNEPELIRRYRTINPEFPHQSTLDQFFSEEQFEAYRELGVHVAEGLFAPALMGTSDAPTGIAAWFRRLAGNLLEREA